MGNVSAHVLEVEELEALSVKAGAAIASSASGVSTRHPHAQLGGAQATATSRNAPEGRDAQEDAWCREQDVHESVQRDRSGGRAVELRWDPWGWHRSAPARYRSGRLRTIESNLKDVPEYRSAVFEYRVLVRCTHTALFTGCPSPANWTIVCPRDDPALRRSCYLSSIDYRLGTRLFTLSLTLEMRVLLYEHLQAFI